MPKGSGSDLRNIDKLEIKTLPFRALNYLLTQKDPEVEEFKKLFRNCEHLPVHKDEPIKNFEKYKSSSDKSLFHLRDFEYLHKLLVKYYGENAHGSVDSRRHQFKKDIENQITLKEFRQKHPDYSPSRELNNLLHELDKIIKAAKAGRLVTSFSASDVFKPKNDVRTSSAPALYDIPEEEEGDSDTIMAANATEPSRDTPAVTSTESSGAAAAASEDDSVQPAFVGEAPPPIESNPKSTPEDKAERDVVNGIDFTDLVSVKDYPELNWLREKLQGSETYDPKAFTRRFKRALGSQSSLAATYNLSLAEKNSLQAILNHYYSKNSDKNIAERRAAIQHLLKTGRLAEENVEIDNRLPYAFKGKNFTKLLHKLGQKINENQANENNAKKTAKVENAATAAAVNSDRPSTSDIQPANPRNSTAEDTPSYSDLSSTLEPIRRRNARRAGSTSSIVSSLMDTEQQAEANEEIEEIFAKIPVGVYPELDTLHQSLLKMRLSSRNLDYLIDTLGPFLVEMYSNKTRAEQFLMAAGGSFNRDSEFLGKGLSTTINQYPTSNTDFSKALTNFLNQFSDANSTIKTNYYTSINYDLLNELKYPEIQPLKDLADFVDRSVSDHKNDMNDIITNVYILYTHKVAAAELQKIEDKIRLSLARLRSVNNINLDNKITALENVLDNAKTTNLFYQEIEAFQRALSEEREILLGVDRASLVEKCAHAVKTTVENGKLNSKDFPAITDLMKKTVIAVKDASDENIAAFVEASDKVTKGHNRTLAKVGKVLAITGLVIFVVAAIATALATAVFLSAIPGVNIPGIITIVLLASAVTAGISAIVSIIGGLMWWKNKPQNSIEGSFGELKEKVMQLKAEGTLMSEAERLAKTPQSETEANMEEAEHDIENAALDDFEEVFAETTPDPERNRPSSPSPSLHSRASTTSLFKGKKMSPEQAIDAYFKEENLPIGYPELEQLKEDLKELARTGKMDASYPRGKLDFLKSIYVWGSDTPGTVPTDTTSKGTERKDHVERANTRIRDFAQTNPPIEIVEVLNKFQKALETQVENERREEYQPGHLRF